MAGTPKRQGSLFSSVVDLEAEASLHSQDFPGAVEVDVEKTDPHLVSINDPTSLEAEQYRTLYQRLEQLRKQKGISLIAISSPSVGDGKTTTAINLATVWAATGTRVLLVDADLRRPALASRLGLNAVKTEGLTGILQETDLSLEQSVLRCPRLNLSILPAGRSSWSPHGLLRSPRAEVLVREMRKHYEYVIFDTPPLIPFPDCQLIGGLVDGFLVIISVHKTPRKLAEESLKTIDPAKLIGFVSNNDDRSTLGYYYSSYSLYHSVTDESGRSRAGQVRAHDPFLPLGFNDREQIRQWIDKKLGRRRAQSRHTPVSFQFGRIAKGTLLFIFFGFLLSLIFVPPRGQRSAGSAVVENDQEDIDQDRQSPWIPPAALDERLQQVEEKIDSAPVSPSDDTQAMGKTSVNSEQLTRSRGARRNTTGRSEGVLWHLADGSTNVPFAETFRRSPSLPAQ